MMKFNSLVLALLLLSMSANCYAQTNFKSLAPGPFKITGLGEGFEGKPILRKIISFSKYTSTTTSKTPAENLFIHWTPSANATSYRVVTIIAQSYAFSTMGDLGDTRGRVTFIESPKIEPNNSGVKQKSYSDIYIAVIAVNEFGQTLSQDGLYILKDRATLLASQKASGPLAGCPKLDLKNGDFRIDFCDGRIAQVMLKSERLPYPEDERKIFKISQASCSARPVTECLVSNYSTKAKYYFKWLKHPNPKLVGIPVSEGFGGNKYRDNEDIINHTMGAKVQGVEMTCDDYGWMGTPGSVPPAAALFKLWMEEDEIQNPELQVNQTRPATVVTDVSFLRKNETALKIESAGRFQMISSRGASVMEIGDLPPRFTYQPKDKITFVQLVTEDRPHRRLCKTIAEVTRKEINGDRRVTFPLPLISDQPLRVNPRDLRVLEHTSTHIDKIMEMAKIEGQLSSDKEKFQDQTPPQYFNQTQTQAQPQILTDKQIRSRNSRLQKKKVNE